MSESAERKEKFTPGPWIIRTNVKDGTPAIKAFDPKDGRRFELCELWGEDKDTETTEMSRANAALIAAAPDMYAKLESLKRYISESCGDACGSILVIREIDALLAKARGES